MGKFQNRTGVPNPVQKICRIRIQIPDMALEPGRIRPDFPGLIRSGFSPEIKKKPGFGTRTPANPAGVRSGAGH